VLHPRPRARRLYPPMGRQFTHLLCTISPHLRLGLPQGTVAGFPFASDFPSPLPSWDGTSTR